MRRPFTVVGIVSLLVTQTPTQLQESRAITLERTSCFGRCPAYRVRLDSTGKITFTGLNQWADSADTGSVGPSAVEQLFSAFEHAHFFALDASYFPGAPKCIKAGTDHPWLMLTAVVRGQAKTVRYYTGCYGGGATRPVWAGAARPDTAPDPGVLLRLAALVDSVAGTRKWLRSRSR